MSDRAEHRLRRSSRDRMLFGVCGGLGEYFAVDAVILRLLFVLLAFTGFGVLAYVGLAIVMPPDEQVGGRRFDVATASGREGEPDATPVAEYRPLHGSGPLDDERRERRRRTAGAILVLVGLFFLVGNLNIWFLNWSVLWPLLLIALGVAVIIGQTRR